MTALRILILSDGRAGHFNLSEGIAAALGRIAPTTIARLDIRRGRWPGAVLAALVASPMPPARGFRLVHGLDLASLQRADVIVSAGAETLAANVWLARAWAVPNIFYGSLRAFRPTDFAAVLTSYARNADRPRHMLALKPSALDPDRTGSDGPGIRPGPVTPPRRAGLLIGGDAGTFTYREPDWNQLLRFLPVTHAACGVRWLVSNSRRTPVSVSDRVAALARDPASGIDGFLDVRQAGAGTLPALLASVDAVLCTEDSSSMISECIWARLPVLGITPLQFHHTADEGQYRDWLRDNGWCRTLAIAELTPAGLLANLSALTPLEENPLDALATRLTRALPALMARS